MGISRILRCNPFIRGGVDKVPDYFTIRRNPADKFALGFVNTPESENSKPEEIEDEIDFLYEEFEEELIIRDNHPKTSEVVKELVHVKEKNLDLLSVKYVERVKATILSLTDQSVDDSEGLNLKFYELVKDESSKNYFDHIHSSELNVALNDEKSSKIGILIEENYGVYESSSPELAIDIQLNMGVTKEDIEKKNAHLLQYLYLLETIYE